MKTKLVFAALLVAGGLLGGPAHAVDLGGVNAVSQQVQDIDLTTGSVSTTPKQGVNCPQTQVMCPPETHPVGGPADKNGCSTLTCVPDKVIVNCPQTQVMCAPETHPVSGPADKNGCSTMTCVPDKITVQCQPTPLCAQDAHPVNAGEDANGCPIIHCLKTKKEVLCQPTPLCAQDAHPVNAGEDANGCPIIHCLKTKKEVLCQPTPLCAQDAHPVNAGTDANGCSIMHCVKTAVVVEPKPTLNCPPGPLCAQDAHPINAGTDSRGCPVTHCVKTTTDVLPVRGTGGSDHGTWTPGGTGGDTSPVVVGGTDGHDQRKPEMCPNVANFQKPLCPNDATPKPVLSTAGCITGYTCGSPTCKAQMNIPVCGQGEHLESVRDGNGCANSRCVKDKLQACPNVANFMKPVCPDDSDPKPVMSTAGCVTGYTCGAACKAVMNVPVCKAGEHLVNSRDGNGCATSHCEKDKPEICPNVANFMKPICPDDSDPKPVMSTAGCVTGYTCGAACKAVMNVPVCRKGEHLVSGRDGDGCATSRCEKDKPEMCPNVANFMKPICPDDSDPKPVMSTAGCITGYTCSKTAPTPAGCPAVMNIRVCPAGEEVSTITDRDGCHYTQCKPIARPSPIPPGGFTFR